MNVASRERLAREFIDKRLDPSLDASVGVTGAGPGRLAQARMVQRHLPAVERVTVLVITLIVGLHFRSFGAPLLTLAAAATGYLISARLIGWLLRVAGIGLPDELEPLMVVLLLGIVTDYSIFFLEHARERLRLGRSTSEAGSEAAAGIVGIVGTAGIAVALGTVALMAARLDTFRALGPGMGVTVLVGLAVSITLIPASIALFGRLLYWPSLHPGRPPREVTGWRRLRERTTKRAVTRSAAIPVALVGLLLLSVLSLGLRHMRLGFSLVASLPAQSPPRAAATAAAKGFSPGIVSPTLLVLTAPSGRTLSLDDLGRLEERIGRQPGVASVAGPAELIPLTRILGDLPSEVGTPRQKNEARTLILRAFVTPDGHDARMLIVLDDPPLGGSAVEEFRRLQRSLPGLLERTGLSGVRATLAGDTALAAETIDQTVSDLFRIVLAVAILMTALLGVYLRAAVAPLFLVGLSLLAFLATLGATAWTFHAVFGVASMSFFVPFASAVLLISLASDYNIFLVGRIWAQSRERPFRAAIAEAAPAASRAIAVAGITLAASFAVLAILPLRPMRQFAFAMSFGVLLDTFLVRAIIVPTSLAAMGKAAAWPGPASRARVPGQQDG